MPKSCTICGTPRPVLVRCQIDETQTWHFTCPGACWRSVSGGEEDARGYEKEFPHYRYGGMWKDRSANGPTSAKKPKKVKEKQKERRDERSKTAAAAARDVAAKPDEDADADEGAVPADSG